MAVQIVLLRGLNLGSANRIAMADLRTGGEAVSARNWNTVVGLVELARA